MGVWGRVFRSVNVLMICKLVSISLMLCADLSSVKLTEIHGFASD